jgi:DnaJ-class molecular chaperone
MPKNYYIILGISSTSHQDEIKAAYRRLAKEYHPDHYGEGHSPFQVIQEAYSVLGDPVSRRAYDDGRRQKRQRSAGHTTVEPKTSHPGQAIEPLAPGKGQVDLGRALLSRSFETYRPSFESLFDRIVSNFDELKQSEGGQRSSPTVVVTLTPDQAFRGGHVRIMVPARVRCPSCRGYGAVGSYDCWRCSGDGVMAGEYPVMISYPPGIRDGHMVRLSLDHDSIGNLYLGVMFTISDLL